MEYGFDFFDQEINRRGTDCVKWDTLENMFGKELNPMWVADMDFKSPIEVTEALISRAQHPVYGYTEQSEAAAEAMHAFMKRRHGIVIRGEETFPLPGVVSGLRVAVRALSKPGDKIIINTPNYPPFYASILSNDRIITESPLEMDEDSRFSLSLSSVENSLKDGARLMLLCNPQNPVGRCWKREELCELMRLLARYDAILVSDEIHEDFVYEPNVHIPAVSLTEETGCRVVAFTSISKTFNLAGLMQAFGYSRDTQLLDALRNEAQSSGVESGNIFALTATQAAYTYGDSWLDSLKQYLRRGDILLREELSRLLPEAKLSPLEATYLEWLDLRAYHLSCEQLSERTHAAGLGCNAGTLFGSAGEGFLRVNIGCPHKRILLAARQLQKAILG